MKPFVKFLGSIPFPNILSSIPSEIVFFSSFYDTSSENVFQVWRAITTTTNVEAALLMERRSKIKGAVGPREHLVGRGGGVEACMVVVHPLRGD